MADRPEDIPVDQVKSMKKQGIDNDKIVESLQRDGYRSSQIFDAMTQADMKPPKEAEEVTKDFPDIASSIGGGQGQTPPQPSQQNQPQAPAQSMPPANENVEELVESIIDEKWEEIVEDIKKVVDWKNSAEKRMKNIESEMEDLREKFDKLHDAVIGKVGEYDKNIMNVGAEIKAMEKAFSKIIPEFSDSVSQLTELVEDLREDKES